MPLTDLEIKKAKAAAKTYKLADGDGLNLLVKPNGSKLWYMKYRFAGNEKSLAIGKYPYISLAEAREARFNARKLLSDGIDPSAQKQEKKRIAAFEADNTFKAVAEDWHSRNKKKWSAGHADRLIRRLELYALRQAHFHQKISLLMTWLGCFLRVMQVRNGIVSKILPYPRHLSKPALADTKVRSPLTQLAYNIGACIFRHKCIESDSIYEPLHSKDMNASAGFALRYRLDDNLHVLIKAHQK